MGEQGLPSRTGLAAAAEDIASVDAAARVAVGHVAAEEAPGGKKEPGAADGGDGHGRAAEDVASAHAALPTVVGEGALLRTRPPGGDGGRAGPTSVDAATGGGASADAAVQGRGGSGGPPCLRGRGRS